MKSKTSVMASIIAACSLLMGGCASALLSAGPAAAANQLPVIDGPQGPTSANAVVQIGFDTITGLPCVAGKTLTCSTGSGGGGGGAVTAILGAFVDGSIVTIGTKSDASVVDYTGTTPASVTASLNGIKQLLSGPTTIGAGNANIGTTSPTAVTSTNGSGTVTAGGVFQTLLASNANRLGCLIQNPTTATEPLYVSVAIATGSATTAKSISLAPGASFNCLAGPNVITDNIAVTATTTAHAFVELNQ